VSFRSIDGVSTCGQCASLPVALTVLLTGETGMLPAMGIAAGILALLLVLLAIAAFRSAWVFTPKSVVLGAVFVALLVSPYLLNYDYAALLVPLLVLWDSLRHPSQRLGLCLVYLFPALLFAVLGRDGNLFLPLGTIALLFLANVPWTPAKLERFP
jgi:hypothetical protein